MTFENTTTQPVKVKPPVISANERLLPEVLKLVRETPGGVAGLMKQFRDRGLGHVATALTSRDGTRMLLPQQIVHGLGTQQIEALATATKLDTRVVRTELVLLLPQVLEQLANRNPTQSVA
jgi:uncharacterized protein YidB (DUF937 family)